MAKKKNQATASDIKQETSELDIGSTPTESAELAEISDVSSEPAELTGTPDVEISSNEPMDELDDAEAKLAALPDESAVIGELELNESSATDGQPIVGEPVIESDSASISAPVPAVAVVEAAESEDARLARLVAHAERVKGMTNEEIAQMHHNDRCVVQ